MTVLSVFDLRKFEFCRSDVKKFVLVFVIISILDLIPCSSARELTHRDSKKLFGGYRITPMHCKGLRNGKYNKGNKICMFNHECFQRGGEVVGTCMDGFLFGACCQLKSDSQSHIPKGPGVVMTSYLDYPDHDPDEDFDEGDQLNAWHNSFKPIVTPGYRPTDKSHATKPPELVHSSTQSLSAEIISEGVSQITNSLLDSPNKDSNIIYIRPGQDSVHTQSTINHNTAETYLVNKNGTAVDNIARPSDFNVYISTLQTKPSLATSTTPKPSSTPKPVYAKPVFKPKPNKPSSKPTLITAPPKYQSTKPVSQKVTSTTEKYVIVSTVTKDQTPAITSIAEMLNKISNKDTVTPPTTHQLETKTTPSATISPVSYSSGYPNYYLSTGHYVTLKPSAIPHTTISSRPSYVTTIRPNTNKYSTSPNSIEEVQVTSSKPYYSSPFPSQFTSPVDSFNRYPTNPNEFDNSVTTFTYVSSTTTRKPTRTPSTTTTRKPPSTSYIFGSKPSKRPQVTSPSSISTYDIAPDNFGSVTPTVIVLNGLQTAKPETTAEEPQFVEISQEPFKKPVSQITVNNNIQSTNNIYLAKPPGSNSKPTVVITPKPTPNTTPSSYPTTNSPIYVSYTDNVISSTTTRPEIYTSPDDLINFPPVRNPMLNATGSNPGLYINVSTDENDIDVLHDVEFTTPSFLLEDENLKSKMNLFVNKIVGSLQGTFQELHDIVILDKKSNITLSTKATTPKPTKKPLATTRKPAVTTRKPSKPTRPRPTVKPTTTKKPAKPTTAIRKPTTTTPPPTTTRRAATTTTKKPKPTKKVTTTTARATTTTEIEEVTTELYQDTSVDYNDKNLCGVKAMVKSGRIVGGKNAKFGEWPWQVLVRETTWLGLFTKNKCGGVLITNRFVTTAAHCQPGFLASLVAVFGENDISVDLEPKRPVSRNVRRVIVHRQYDAATFENDLALLELESPIKFEPHIVPICMPPDEADFTGRMASVTGWGRLKYGGGVPAVLQEVQVPVIENSVCQEMFQKAGHTKIILNSFLCAGYANGQKDSCEGDSGGPLVLQREDGRWQLVGTVSHGIKCAAPYLPGVYMRTTYYKPWLKSITGVH